MQAFYFMLKSSLALFAMLVRALEVNRLNIAVSLGLFPRQLASAKAPSFLQHFPLSKIQERHHG